jgi:hypothetical protein
MAYNSVNMWWTFFKRNITEKELAISYPNMKK